LKNAESHISSTDSGIVISVSPVQFAKAIDLISFTVDGILRLPENEGGQ
jgi:hypothetical protein